MTISDSDYNNARQILVDAGSNSARASHPKHTNGMGSPERYGKQLLREAIDEFRRTDVNAQALTRGMTRPHFVAVRNAAEEMSMDIEDVFRKMGE